MTDLFLNEAKTNMRKEREFLQIKEQGAPHKPSYPQTFAYHLACALTSTTSRHTTKMVAQVQKPAPTFKAQAVVDGVFQDVSLSEYLGQW